MEILHKKIGICSLYIGEFIGKTVIAEVSEVAMAQNKKQCVAAIVVTFDNPFYLRGNIEALLTQSIELNQIYIVNNGDNLQTDSYIRSLVLRHSKVISIKTKYNMGGAGGFHEGLRLALQSRNEWFWLMDDDCLPDGCCLENLILHANNKRHAYEPLVYDIRDGSTILYDKNRKPNSDIPEVKIHTFNGFLVNREIVEEIGLPKKEFFIYWDDIEYCLRINRAGGKVFLNTYAKMFHPNKVQEKQFLFFAYRNYDFNKLHVYYATRNMIILDNWYGGFRLELIEILRRLILYCITLRFDLVRLFINAIIDGKSNNMSMVIP